MKEKSDIVDISDARLRNDNRQILERLKKLLNSTTSRLLEPFWSPRRVHFMQVEKELKEILEKFDR